MTTIKADIICDSVNKYGCRITTYLLEFPRIILAELNTHRVFSKNSSSSRAIPLKKQIQRILDDPYVPISWGKNQPGMSSKEELDEESMKKAHDAWLDSMDSVIFHVKKLDEIGLHKQFAARLLEPYMHQKVVLTGTEFENFFWLRNHEDAQPEFQILASLMKEAYDSNTPEFLEEGKWHLPFISEDEKNTLSEHELLNLSVARCASTSYLSVDGYEMDLSRATGIVSKLFSGSRLHASPFEHQATPDILSGNEWKNESQHRNFVGWRQYRAMIEDYIE